MGPIMVEEIMMKLPTKLLNTGATVPTYGSDSAAGLDLYANFYGDRGHDIEPHGYPHDFRDDFYRLTPGTRKLFKTGVAMAIPTGMYGRIAPRSGLAYKNGLDVMAGVIDSDYRKDIGIILINLGEEDYVVKHGDRIAQMILEYHGTGNPEVVDDLPETNRDGGWGSTGR